MEKRYRKLAENTFFFALGTLGSRSIAFFMLPLYTRLLTPRDYGTLDVFQTTVSLLVPILSLEIVEAVFRFSMDEAQEGAKRVLSTALPFSFLSLLLSLALTPVLFRFEIFQAYLPYFYAVFFLTVLLGEAKQYVRALGKVKIFALSDILYVLFFAGLNVVFMVFLRMGLRGYFLSYVLAQACSFLFVAFSGRIFPKISFRFFDRELAREMLRYSIPLIPNALMWWIMNVSDRYLILYFLGLEANGIYAVACRFPALLGTVTGVFFPAWQLSAVEEFHSEDRAEYYARVFSLYSSALFLLTGFILLFLPEITGLFVASNFKEAWRFVPFLLIGTVFHSFASFLGTIYVASKKTLGAFSTTALGGATNFLLNLVFIPLWGIQGAAFTTMLGFLVVWVARVIHMRKICPFPLNLQSILLPVLVLGGETVVLFLRTDDSFWLLLNFCLFALLLLFHKSDLVKLKGLGVNFIREAFGGKKHVLDSKL
jgi:O-antigen/teichoic acid export membrane protein